MLLALPAAHAADLDLKVTSDGIGPVSVTLRDVKPGAAPAPEQKPPEQKAPEQKAPEQKAG